MLRLIRANAAICYINGPRLDRSREEVSLWYIIPIIRTVNVRVFLALVDSKLRSRKIRLLQLLSVCWNNKWSMTKGEFDQLMTVDQAWRKVRKELRVVLSLSGTDVGFRESPRAILWTFLCIVTTIRQKMHFLSFLNFLLSSLCLSFSYSFLYVDLSNLSSILVKI